MLRKCLFAAAACAALGFTASSAEAGTCARGGGYGGGYAGGYGGYYGGYGPRVSYYHGYRPSYHHRSYYHRPYYGQSLYRSGYGGYPRSGVSFSIGF